MLTCAACGGVLTINVIACPVCGSPVSPDAVSPPAAVSADAVSPPSATNDWWAPPVAAPQPPATNDWWAPPAAAPQPFAAGQASRPLQAAAATRPSDGGYLVLVLVGALLVVLSTFVAWDLNLLVAAGPPMYGPTVDASYWTGLTPANLRTFGALDVTLYLADVVVSVLCLVGGVLALVALARGGRFSRRLTATFGVAALAVFSTELVRWLVDSSVVLGLGVSIVGAALVVIGSLSYRGPATRA